jgi:peptide/nickel transport system permease protein
MWRYVTKRVAHALFVMWLVATTVFFGLRVIPGGPVRTMLGQEATPAAVRSLRRELGLNRPVPIQYFDWMTDLLVLDLGTSITSSSSVTTLIAAAAPRTISIGAFGVVLGLAVAIPAGVIAATHKNETSDYIATIIAFLGISMPAFFVGILLAIVFGVWLGWFPVIGYNPLAEGVVPWLRSIVLPGIAVGLPYAAGVTRMMRSSLLEVLDQQYMRTALVKGLSGNTQLYKHALQNALIPVITVAGIQLALVLGGTVTVEIVFGIKGLGRLLVNSILDRDYPVTQATILLISGIFVFMNLIVDIAYTAIDPRIRYGGDEA